MVTHKLFNPGMQIGNGFSYPILLAILALNLTLNVYGNSWGGTKPWHPDELIAHSTRMVTQRTLNPGSYPYGGLGYYIFSIGAVVPSKIFSKVFDPIPIDGTQSEIISWKEREKTRIISLARLVSALLSTLTVTITYIIGTVLFNRKIGCLASLLLCLSNYFIALAHFATIDSTANFFYWLACLLTLGVWKKGNAYWYTAAAIFSGLAIGIKVDRVLILLPLALSHFLNTETKTKNLWIFLVFIPFGFILANPMMILNPFLFLDGFTRDLFFNALRPTGTSGSSYLKIFIFLKDGLGFPLFLLSLFGILVGSFSLIKQKAFTTLIWLLSTLIPYYLAYGSKLIAPWYIPIFFPALMILASFSFFSTIEHIKIKYVMLSQAIMIGVIGYSFFYCVSLISLFINDSRILASKWIDLNAKPGSVIETVRAQGPNISRERFEVIVSDTESSAHDFVVRWRGILIRNPLYQTVSELIVHLEKQSHQNFGTAMRDKRYQAWFDRRQKHMDNQKMTTSGTPKTRKINPDYILLAEGRRPKYFSTLNSINSGYTLVKSIHYNSMFGMKQSFPFLNPAIFIFKKNHQ